MLFISAFTLEVLICLHVIGGALLFHRVFPRESPWWGFFLPTLAFVSLLNFIEHFLALPNLVWLLPFTTGGSIWLMAHPATSWRFLRFPSVLFVAVFTFVLAIKCMQPDVNFYCTEGLTDLTRILDFTLGDKVPPSDCWLPLYPHVGYYTFMHYGASVLKRLMGVDVGTAYNVGSVFLNSLVLLACAAVASSLSNRRPWVTGLTLLVMLGGFTGSTPIKALLHPLTPNPVSSIDISLDWDNPALNEFSWFLKHYPPGDAYRIYTPGCYVYYSEFHATIAGHFLDLLALFGVVEVLRRRRTLFPWIYLIVAPFLTVISCTWFLLIVTLLAWPTLALAWVMGRRPYRLQAVLVGAAVTLALLWPTLSSFTHGAISQKLLCFTDWKHDYGMLLFQFWPIYVTWIALCFVWKRFSLAGRWLHLWLLPLFAITELAFFTDRQTTLEKTMGGFFGLGLTVLCPLLFLQKGWAFRGLSAVLLMTGIISIYAWTIGIYQGTYWTGSFMHLEGDYYIQREPQMHRMEEILRQMKGQTVLVGKNTEAWFESPSLPAFTENRCFVGWTNAEESCGNGDVAHARADQTNAFYSGTMADPLAFLQANDIAAVLVWPDDKMPDDWLATMTAKLAPEYTYHDCKGDGPNNAGIFIRSAMPQ